MNGVARAMTVFFKVYVTSVSGGFPVQASVPRGVTYSPANFFIARAVASGSKPAALPSLISIILKKYSITSLTCPEPLNSEALDYDAIPGNASLNTSATVICRAQPTTHHNRRCA